MEFREREKAYKKKKTMEDSVRINYGSLLMQTTVLYIYEELDQAIKTIIVFNRLYSQLHVYWRMDVLTRGSSYKRGAYPIMAIMSIMAIRVTMRVNTTASFMIESIFGGVFVR